MLSPESAAVVRATLPAVGGALDEITTRFYGTMFAEQPDLLDGVFNRGNQASGPCWPTPTPGRTLSFPGGVPSHVAPETPGSIHEDGELGYSLSHAYGAALDNPDLVVACVIGDGEAETGHAGSVRPPAAGRRRRPGADCGDGAPANSRWMTRSGRSRANLSRSSGTTMGSVSHRCSATSKASAARLPNPVIMTPRPQGLGSGAGHRLACPHRSRAPEGVGPHRPLRCYEQAGVLAPASLLVLADAMSRYATEPATDLA